MSAEPVAPEGAASLDDPTPLSPWEQVLGEVESGLDDAEALVAPGYLLDADPAVTLGGWTPPTGLGPMPAELAERALAILDRQSRLAPRLEEAARAARSHLRAVGAMRTHDTSTSVYVDAIG